MRRWYLGIHRPNWLERQELAEVPVFITRRVFPRVTFPVAIGPYAIDSGGFTELQKFGEWTITAAEYVAFLRRVWNETGRFDFAAPMDWMCEPWVIEGGWHEGRQYAGTHLPVSEHQQLTVDNYLELRDLAPDLPIIPVLQGWMVTDYLRCADMYAAAGVDLATAPLVGLGSLCRRQNTDEAAEIIDALRDYGVGRLHGFGFKIEGLKRTWWQIETADSMSWSKDGSHAGPCVHPPYARGFQPQSEANCLPYALAWRKAHIQEPAKPYVRQTDLLTAIAVSGHKTGEVAA